MSFNPIHPTACTILAEGRQHIQRCHTHGSVAGFGRIRGPRSAHASTPIVPSAPVAVCAVGSLVAARAHQLREPRINLSPLERDEADPVFTCARRLLAASIARLYPRRRAACQSGCDEAIIETASDTLSTFDLLRAFDDAISHAPIVLPDYVVRLAAARAFANMTRIPNSYILATYDLIRPGARFAIFTMELDGCGCPGVQAGLDKCYEGAAVYFGGRFDNALLELLGVPLGMRATILEVI